VILGASFDTPEDNLAFAEAQEFPYRLLSDPSREIGEQYGVKRGADEQYADYPKRVTFLIDPAGIVRKVYEVTDVAKNPQDVLDDIEDLSA
jgi:peroxiredoxin Q/BCP